MCRFNRVVAPTYSPRSPGGPATGLGTDRTGQGCVRTVAPAGGCAPRWCSGPDRSAGTRDRTRPAPHRRRSPVADLALVVLTLGVFAVLALVVRALERM